jgi:putative salt-induced outer membrane protein YdiY
VLSGVQTGDFMKLVALLLSLSMLFATVANAAKTVQETEVIHFKNGDRLTGAFERFIDGKLMFKTKNVGEVSISLHDVAGFSSEKPVVVMLTKGRAVKGLLSLSEKGQWEVRPEGKAPEQLSAKDIEAVYPVSVYKASETARRSRPWRFWSGKGSLGYTLENGDQSARSLAFDFAGQRVRPPLPGMKERYRTTYSLNALAARTTTLEGVTTSTNSISTSLRQDFFFKRDPRNFLFALGQLDHIKAQSLALRQTYGGGFGRDVIRGPNTTLSLLGGVTYVHERFFSQPGDSKAEGLLGERFSFHLWRLGFDHSFTFDPAITESGQYRFDTSTVISSPISKLLTFQVGFTDHFLSNPLPNHKKSDSIVTTGVGFRF